MTDAPPPFDVQAELAALSRAVRRTDRTTVTATLTRTFPASADAVWAALTEPDRVAAWFYPLSGDLRRGGTYQLEGSMGGRIRRCEPGRRLEVTFGMKQSTVDVRLTADDGGTRLELAHGVPLALAGSGAAALYVGPGWDGALVVLGLHLAGIEVGDPLVLASTPLMAKVHDGAVDAWAEAVVASGTATAEQVVTARGAVARAATQA
ncbi:ATPase [Cellulomonas sp. APG4]|uniref:SRPBCC domain-containing protein n=1 Tax=Cellulomonas sp. APG4 TaxID=1538656 RepID=UPI00137B2DD0|nr:SRPBCC domain-containing protein [Cellulomonas sp. APG4]NCT92478.1 ATPase [Cellulomonas sp. APG4]